MKSLHVQKTTLFLQRLKIEILLLSSLDFKTRYVVAFHNETGLTKLVNFLLQSDNFLVDNNCSKILIISPSRTVFSFCVFVHYLFKSDYIFLKDVNKTIFRVCGRRNESEARARQKER